MEETHENGEQDFSDYEIIVYVRGALQSAFTDDTGEYSRLIALLHYNERLGPDEVALLVTSLKALSGAARSIDSVQHGDLLNTILNMSLWNYGPDVMDALIELITSLAVSSGKFVDACLGMLVSNFAPPYRFVDALKMPYGIARKENVLDRVHSALDYIAGLVPLAPSRLCPIIRERMPKVFQQSIKVPALILFVENILKLESSAIGELVGRTMLISAVVDLLIDFDVDIGWDEILQENSSKGIFELELEDEQIPDDEDDDGGEFGKESWGQKRLWKSQVYDRLEKLDSLMVLTFQHLKFCKDSGRLEEVFDYFLHSFQSTILTAYKSKFAQFVIFYACSLCPESCGVRFAELLADIYLNRNFPFVTRMSAVSYLASYLARGRFVQNSSVMGSLKRLIKWCSDYCISHGGDFDPTAHRVFYSGCQAIFYILCFRMKSIMEIPHLNTQLSRFPLRQILKSSLEPLKVCLPSIVEEFMQQAESVNLLDERGAPIFDDMLESEFSKAFGGIERLDSFFPFDPCLLRKCDSYIRPNFVYWSMVRKTYEDDEESCSDEDDVEVIYPDVNGDDGVDFDEFNDSLNKMSITPGDSFLKKNMEMPSRLRPSMSPELM
ncbi:hypothetical protein RND81_12G155100 [Saponaria officinalis]|uniref:RNA polymerase I-specific transcription initiation factor RRN3 n=1 Tax=Saponaria officinalis TaxID=3572 RepID=A0AAW1HB20_SAPOF